MNEDGVGITIPHDNQQENTQVETPVTSNAAILSDPEPSFNESIDNSLEDNTPVLPQAAPLTPNISTNRSSNTFNATQDLKQDNSKVPDFFNNAIATAKASNEQTKRRNRKLFFTIGLVIGVIAIIAIIVLVVIPFISNSILNQKLSANNKEIRVVFNEYANYVLNGTESTDEIGEYDPGKNYNLIAIYRRGDAKELAAFYRKADEKYKKVKEKVNELYTEDDENRTQITVYSANFSLSYSHAIHGDYSEKELAKVYLANGEEAAMQKVKTFYSEYETEDYSSTYIGDAMTYYESLIDILKYYTSNNCNNSNDILNGVCYEKFENDATFRRIVSAKDDAFERKRLVMMYANECVYEQIWSIYEQIKE